MDIILVPTYNRPDYLRLCLEYLAAAEGVQDKEIWICIDRGRSLIRDFYEVLNDFRNSLHIVTKIRPDHSYIGNSFNTLEAYNEAYQTDAEFVYLVEDDVLVTRDFFKWHDAVQKCGNFICSIAYRCSRNSEVYKDITDPAAYFTTSRDYASIGVCWKRQNLGPVVKHARVEYYEDLKGYLAKNFPNNRFSDCFVEQDGLVMRLLGESHGDIAFCYIPRCYHIGFAGYNRPRSPHLSYSEIKETIHSKEKVEAADKDFKDIEVVPLSDVSDWSPSQLHCIQHFN